MAERIGVGPRVLVADDHAPTRAAVRIALERDSFVICAEVGDAVAAIRAAGCESPDLALLDVRMPGGGIRATAEITAEHPELPVVILTVSDEDDDLFAALAAGASAYIVKGGDPADIPATLRRVLVGEGVLAGQLLKRLFLEYRRRSLRERVHKGLPDGARLTPKEWEVLDLLVEGRDTAEIARRLFVSDATVRSHVAALTHKLRVPSRADALRLARGISSDRGSGPRSSG